MSFVSGCIAALDWVDAVDEPLSEQADNVTTAKQTRQTNMRCFIASDYARGMPKVKWEELPLDYADERHAAHEKMRFARYATLQVAATTVLIARAAAGAG